MDQAKADFLREFFNQIESQVQFGDNKASLLIAGDAILLAVSGGVVKMVSGCQTDTFGIDCVVPSPQLMLAAAAAILLVLSLASSLWAATPSRVHVRPRRELFLMSSVARMTQEEFLEWYRAATNEDLLTEALIAIHGKAAYATRKFLWLRRAIHTSLLSLAFLVAAVVTSVLAG